jgi:hypothetical protein
MANVKDPHWIEHSHLKKGSLRDKTHPPAGKDISAKRLHAAAHSKNDTIRKRTEPAETLKDLRK